VRRPPPSGSASRAVFVEVVASVSHGRDAALIGNPQ
jgi:hypothetical protein